MVRFLMRRRPAWVGAGLLVLMLAGLLVPAGFMPAAARSGVMLRVCAGTMPDAHQRHHPIGQPAGEQPCAFAGLGVAGGDAVVAPVVAPPLAFAPARPLPRGLARRTTSPPRLRPPLRAPPRLA